MKKIMMTVAVLAAMTMCSWGDVLWDGRLRGIVTTNQFFASAGRSGTFSTVSDANPVVGSNYYPNTEGANPYFSAAESTTISYAGRVVPNIMEKDCIYQQSAPVAMTNFKSMVLWDWTEGAPEIIEMEVGAVGKSASVRFIVEKDSDYFISQIIGTISSAWTLIGGSASTMTWYDFQPFVGGVATIGDTALEDFFLSEITGVGYYSDAVNTTPVTTLV